MNTSTPIPLPDGRIRLVRLAAEKPERFTLTDFSDEWQLLEDSEILLIGLMSNHYPKPNENFPGDIEFGFMLYWLNNDKVLRDLLHPPASKITSQMMAEWKQELRAPGAVGGDGTLFIENVPYAQLDPGWLEAAALYFYYKLDPSAKAPFATTPAKLSVNRSSLSIAVFGDWGTGSWMDGSYQSPSQLVGKAIINQNPEISMHLGDVYHAGTELAETVNLLAAFPKGSLYNFTLNSNHEMYDGANGYFNTALSNSLFSPQNGTSYFALTFQDWVIIGLDSAYYDTSAFYMAGGLSNEQSAFIANLKITGSQKILVFTHHTGLRTDGAVPNTNPKTGSQLLNQLYKALGNRYPDFWYYGHIHNGIVYNDRSFAGSLNTIFGKHPQLRCMGHAAIPFGKAYWLEITHFDPVIRTEYYAQTPISHPDPQQQSRVRNGFAMLTLSKSAITEDIYEVDSSGNAVLMKKISTTF